MKDRLKKNFNLLTFLGRCKNKTRRLVLRESDKELVDAICDCVLNVCNGVVPINKHAKTKLKKHKIKLRQLTDTKSSTKKKRRILIQNGGSFLTVLLPIVTSAIAPLLQ